MGSRDNAALFRPATWQLFHLPDDLCHVVTSLHFLVALVLDLCRISRSFNTVIMPPKINTKVKKTKRANNAPKRTPRKATKKAQTSTAIQQDLKIEEEYMGDETMFDLLQGMANRLDRTF